MIFRFGMYEQKNILALSFVIIIFMMITPITGWVFAKNDNSDNTQTTGQNNKQEDNQNEEEKTNNDKNDEITTLQEASDNPNGNDDNVRDGDNEQPDRVGSHDEQTSENGNAKGGEVTDDTLCSETDDPDCSTTVSSNCFGKVISHEAQEHKEEPESGTLGEHASDPVPEIEGNETPRQGIGNQDQGHPAAHGAFNSQFEEDDENNVNENC